jgi:hypothetical protein
MFRDTRTVLRSWIVINCWRPIIFIVCFDQAGSLYCDMQRSVYTGKPKAQPCVAKSAAKLVLYNHKCHFYYNIYLWSKIEFQYAKFTTAQSPLNLARTFSIPPEDIDFFPYFLQNIVKIGI